MKILLGKLSSLQGKQQHADNSAIWIHHTREKYIPAFWTPRNQICIWFNSAQHFASLHQLRVRITAAVIAHLLHAAKDRAEQGWETAGPELQLAAGLAAGHVNGEAVPHNFLKAEDF